MQLTYFLILKRTALALFSLTERSLTWYCQLRFVSIFTPRYFTLSVGYSLLPLNFIFKSPSNFFCLDLNINALLDLDVRDEGNQLLLESMNVGVDIKTLLKKCSSYSQAISEGDPNGFYQNSNILSIKAAPELQLLERKKYAYIHCKALK